MLLQVFICAKTGEPTICALHKRTSARSRRCRNQVDVRSQTGTLDRHARAAPGGSFSWLAQFGLIAPDPRLRWMVALFVRTNVACVSETAGRALKRIELEARAAGRVGLAAQQPRDRVDHLAQRLLYISSDPCSAGAYFPEFESGSAVASFPELSSPSAVPTAATPAATTAAFATFFATFLSFDRLFGIVSLADAWDFAGARVARLAEDLGLAFVTFAGALALPRLARFFIIPSGVILHCAY
jgi:hypothetical protein